MDPFFERREDNILESFSPSRKRGRVYGDRFIPLRRTDSWWKLQSNSSSPNDKSANPQTPSKKKGIYSTLLRNELFGGSNDENNGLIANESEGKSIFQYGIDGSPRRKPVDFCYSISPLAKKSQQLLCDTKMHPRKFSRTPYRDLGVPGLEDDFYLNLLDWSSRNTIAVGICDKVYIWSASTREIMHSYDMSGNGSSAITSVAFNENGNYLSIGTSKGHISLWDVEADKIVSSYYVHNDRIGCMHWNKDLLASGSKDRSIVISDLRSGSFPYLLNGHKQEVCGLKWSPNSSHLASGSNDNHLLVWNPFSSPAPIKTFTKHKAAVKALDWSSHHHGLLASGGGTADRTMRVWDTLDSTTDSIACIDTGSQVCTLAWSKKADELITTHGYSLNEILLWEYPSMECITRFSGHSTRVLYLALSPDGESIVTGAGDESLKFWSIYPKTKSQRIPNSPLNFFTGIR